MQELTEALRDMHSWKLTIVSECSETPIVYTLSVFRPMGGFMEYHVFRGTSLEEVTRKVGDMGWTR